MSDVLDRATRALKDSARADDGRGPSDVASRTREQILARAELGRRERRVTRAILLPIAASFILVASWAAASGALHDFFSPPPAPPLAPAPTVTAAPTSPPRAHGPAVPATAPEPVPEPPAPEVAPPVAPPVAVAVTPIAAPTSPPRASAVRIERVAPPITVTDALYADAHRAHFEAHDWPRALAAWDAYLADAPSGRFAPEATFNRALCLIRLGRRAEAEAALRPIAASHGYRAAEAAELIDAIDAGR